MLYQLSYAHQRCFQNLTTFRREPAFEIGLNFRGPDSSRFFEGSGELDFSGRKSKTPTLLDQRVGHPPKQSQPVGVDIFSGNVRVESTC